MRRILAASILLSPLFFTASAVASTPANDASATTMTRPISTGVVPAQVISSQSVELPSSANIPAGAEVVLQLNVGEDGKARDISVVKSVNPELDAPVVAAVRKFRFSPAKLDNQAIEVPLSLTVFVQK
jgi:TonB family protein